MLPGTVRWIPPVVKRPQMQWNRLDGHRPRRSDAGRARRRAVGVLRALAARRAGRCRRPSPPRASTAAQSTPRSVRDNVFATPVPSRRSPAAPACNCSATSSKVAAAARDRALPGDRPPRRSGRATHDRATTASETVYGDDPVAVAAGVRRRRRDVDPRRRSRRGASRVDPVNRPVVARHRRGGRRSVPRADGWRRAHDRRRRSAGRRGRGAGRDGLGGRARPGARRRGVERSCRSRSDSTTATASSPSTAGPRAAASRLDEALGRFPTAAAFVITDIARDGMLAGPDVDGLAAAVVRRTDDPGHRQRRRRLARRPRRACRDSRDWRGVITGKALYEGRFTVAEALASVAGGR